MALPPFDGTGWITGMPGLPGAPVVMHVITADAAHVHWDGTAWAAGDGAALDEDTLSGWTKAELTEFAAAHEPPIEIPSGATKAQIIALILAAIQADPNEEN